MKIGIISDIHEDLPGLQRAIKLLDKKSCNEIFCLGDISGYSLPYFKHQLQRDASACLKLIRQTCSIILPGNHDLYACRIVPKSNPGFDYPANWYELDFAAKQQIAGMRIWLYEDNELESNYTDEDKQYISELPEFVNFELEGRRVLLSHYLYPDLTGSSSRFIPDSELEKSHLKFIKDQNGILSFFGHSHVEGLWLIKEGKIDVRKKVKHRDYKEALAIGIPCIANGRNEPGYVTFDVSRGIIESHKLYNSFKRLIEL